MLRPEAHQPRHDAYPAPDVEIWRVIRRALFARFGLEAPVIPVDWPTDNEEIYASLESVISKRSGIT